MKKLTLSVMLAAVAVTAAAEETGASNTVKEERFTISKDEIFSRPVKGLSTYKEMYIAPVSYSPSYKGEETEVIFQLSAKHHLFNTNLFFGYTQKSFWQLYNKEESSPFRETNYNPEIFYRYFKERDATDYWGADFGFEHESNGQTVEKSRSWNRLYIAPYWTDGRTGVRAKIWYRLPEKNKENPTDATGDDNPDIHRYYGYGELRGKYLFWQKHQLSAMVRGNVSTGKGAIEAVYTIPNQRDDLFFRLGLFSGYGESLIDYNRSINRVTLAVAFVR